MLRRGRDWWVDRGGGNHVLDMGYRVAAALA